MRLVHLQLQVGKKRALHQRVLLRGVYCHETEDDAGATAYPRVRNRHPNAILQLQKDQMQENVLHLLRCGSALWAEMHMRGVYKLSYAC